LISKGNKEKVFYEAHSYPSSRIGRALQRWLAPKLDGLIVLTKLLAQCYVDAVIPLCRVAVIADAVDIEAFGQCSRVEARQELGIGPNDFVVMYVGQMYKWKGVETLVAAATFMPDDARIWVVGGTPEELPRIERLVRETAVGRVRMVGYVPPTQIPTHLAAADVLALPNSAQAEVSRYYTSPLKLFEYMAAERPIIASDLPALREIITHEETALLVPPDDARVFAAAVERLHADAPLARRLAANARNVVAGHTWENRATRILEFIQPDDDP
jgi:glycosyltransferase involved in cell wall biosynthesis